ncbi:MAG: hypothetical protein M0R69_01355 [Candidatus Cloacimonetes bacterium]|nr:hypothetical protein [Candidatus Cloacimonadota bacterium]
MAWKELIDESKIGAAGGVVGIDSAGKIAVPVAGFDRDIVIADLNITKADVGLGNVENKSSAKILSELTAADIPDIGISQVTGLATGLSGKVPTTRKVAGQALTADVVLTKHDVGLGDVDNLSPAGIFAKMVAADIPDIGIGQVTGLATGLSGKVPTSRKVAGKALTADVVLAKADVGLGNVENLDSAGIFAKLTGEDISAAGVKTSDLITTVTTLPASGTVGEIVMKGGSLFVWQV